MLSFVSNIFSRPAAAAKQEAAIQPQVIESVGPTKPSYADILKKNATETPALPNREYVPGEHASPKNKKDRKVSEASTTAAQEDDGDYHDMYKARHADSLKCERVAKQSTIKVLKEMGVLNEEGEVDAKQGISHSAKARKMSTGKWSVKGTVEDKGVAKKKGGKHATEY